ncbi:MAG: hypothetical protein QOG72_1571 [Sphingomonadales bacterium]|jgi:hypothetical protein|nr:hypothetical protein [Sphingomonadales bacterium]
MIKTCRAPGCTETSLCHAHIIPAGFARTLSDLGGHNKAIRSTGAKPAKQPHGEFDAGILCPRCDGKLGAYDEYAIRFCDSLSMTRSTATGGIFRHAPFDGPQFARAILAILWRASVSERDQFRDINLGPYRERAAAILFEEKPLSSFPEFEVVLHRYASDDHDARKFVFMPLRIRSGALNAFTIGLGGFLVWAKVDQRPIHRLLAEFVINAAFELGARIIHFEETAEYAYFQQAAQKDHRRGRGSAR